MVPLVKTQESVPEMVPGPVETVPVMETNYDCEWKTVSRLCGQGVKEKIYSFKAWCFLVSEK